MKKWIYQQLGELCRAFLLFCWAMSILVVAGFVVYVFIAGLEHLIRFVEPFDIRPGRA